MGLLTNIEFARNCDISSGTLRVNIKRNKVNFVTVKGENGKPKKMFDTDDPINALFISKYKVIRQASGPRAKQVKTKRTKPLNTGKKIDVSGVDLSESELTPDQMSAVELDLEKKRLEILKTKEQVEIERMKKEKMQGEVIPTDLVTLLFSQHFKNVTLQFKEEAEKIVGVMVKQLGGKNKDRIEIVARLEDSINVAISAARDATAADIGQLVQEHSVKRGRGERK